MSDIVERLRTDNEGCGMRMEEAADTIESLRQRVAELEEDKRKRDEWLSNGIYFTEAEYAEHLDELAAIKEEQRMEAEGPDWIQRAMQAEAELDAIKGKQEPEFGDGCSLEGFVGGCERMGCHPAPIPEGWQKDAERYRWLRYGDNDHDALYFANDASCGTDTVWLLRDEDLDAAIDKAMLAAAPKPPS